MFRPIGILLNPLFKDKCLNKLKSEGNKYLNILFSCVIENSEETIATFLDNIISPKKSC